MDKLFAAIEALAFKLTGLKFGSETPLTDRHRGNLIGLYGLIGVTIFSFFSIFRFIGGDRAGAVVDFCGAICMFSLY